MRFDSLTCEVLPCRYDRKKTPTMAWVGPTFQRTFSLDSLCSPIAYVFSPLFNIALLRRICLMLLQPGSFRRCQSDHWVRCAIIFAWKASERNTWVCLKKEDNFRVDGVGPSVKIHVMLAHCLLIIDSSQVELLDLRGSPISHHLPISRYDP